MAAQDHVQSPNSRSKEQVDEEIARERQKLANLIGKLLARAWLKQHFRDIPEQPHGPERRWDPEN